MKHLPTLCLLLSAVSAAAAAADTPQTLYTAHLPHSPSAQVSGYLNLTSSSGISLSLTIPDASLGPFTYHIHTLPVPPSGDCSGTGGHFDISPSPRKKTKCNPTKPEECEAGDLSGKWGMIPAFQGRMQVEARYTDPYVRVKEVRRRRGRSVVVHDREGRRIACADLVAVGKKVDGDEGKDGEGGKGKTVTKTVTTTVVKPAATAGGDKERERKMDLGKYVPRRRRGVVWRG
ncbi:hypothetical protein K440DRAFT_619574 [Wilcoxina mikolae CBS 423.85]|nr:hypothetical protein K440DRAFT_619574 [Wilcoxina mikolae CBS 423.85]